MQTLKDEKAAIEKPARLARAGKNKASREGGTTVGFDGAGQPQKADVVVHMGEVVSSKNAPNSNAGKGAKSFDKKEELREDRASSLV